MTVLEEAARGAFVSMLCWRFGRMEGRSVRWMWVAKRAEAARPTRPVPAPSSRMRMLGGFVVAGGDVLGGG